jgi:6-pyruvoyltetrahydropterin/6-carboxytetrahydropterin synthase
MLTSVMKEFTFEAAHFLPNVPEGHKCKRLHGHSYRVRVEIEGVVREPIGMVVDYADVKGMFDELVTDVLDHRLLNEIPGLENSTSENLSRWIFSRLDEALPPELILVDVYVWETATAGSRTTREI